MVKVFPTGDVRVVVNYRTWTYNPRCLSHAPTEELTDDQCMYVYTSHTFVCIIIHSISHYITKAR